MIFNPFNYYFEWNEILPCVRLRCCASSSNYGRSSVSSGWPSRERRQIVGRIGSRIECYHFKFQKKKKIYNTFFYKIFNKNFKVGKLEKKNTINT